MKLPKKTVTATIAAILAVALVAGWCVWRQHVASEKAKSSQASVQQSTKRKAQVKRENDAQSTKQDEQNRLIAVQMEKDMRNWGVDSLANPTQWAGQSSSQVLAALRTPESIEQPADMPTSIKKDDAWGSDAVSYVCRNGYESYCETMPTAQTWFRNEVWGIGTRWKSEPVVKTVDSTTVRVTGTVRSILVTSGDTFTLGGYNALTPAWKDYHVDDLLTISGGKVSSISYRGSMYWWVNPFLSEWTPDDVAASMGEGNRIAIPVSGALNWDGMNPTGITRVMKSPQSMGDMDGTVDWSMWDDLSQAGNTSEPSQQAPGLDPEKDAATLKDREY